MQGGSAEWELWARTNLDELRTGAVMQPDLPRFLSAALQQPVVLMGEHVDLEILVVRLVLRQGHDGLESGPEPVLDVVDDALFHRDLGLLQVGHNRINLVRVHPQPGSEAGDRPLDVAVALAEHPLHLQIVDRVRHLDVEMSVVM